jgi:competence protein ComEA
MRTLGGNRRGAGSAVCSRQRRSYAKETWSPPERLVGITLPKGGERENSSPRVGDRVSEAAANASEKCSDPPPKKTADRESAPSESDDLINTVGREELMSVNGIGPALADRIISGRPYSSRRELVERGILPQSTFDELERELGRRGKRSA